MQFQKRFGGLMPAMMMAGIGILLAGCATNQNKGFATYQGAAPSLPIAEYQVLGKTKYDQTWVDRTIEAEVAGFNIPRPKPRPANLDSKPAIVAQPLPEAAPVVTVGPTKHKRSFWRRVFHRKETS